MFAPGTHRTNQDFVATKKVHMSCSSMLHFRQRTSARHQDSKQSHPHSVQYLVQQNTLFSTIPCSARQDEGNEVWNSRHARGMIRNIDAARDCIRVQLLLPTLTAQERDRLHKQPEWHTAARTDTSTYMQERIKIENKAETQR